MCQCQTNAVECSRTYYVIVYQRADEMRCRTTRRLMVLDWLSCLLIPPTWPKAGSWAWPGVPSPAAVTKDSPSHAGMSALTALPFQSAGLRHKRVICQCFSDINKLLSVWSCIPAKGSAYSCTHVIAVLIAFYSQRLKKTDHYLLLFFFGLLFLNPFLSSYSPELSSMIIKTGNASGCRLTRTPQEFWANRTSTTNSIKRKVPSTFPLSLHQLVLKWRLLLPRYHAIRIKKS